MRRLLLSPVVVLVVAAGLLTLPSPPGFAAEGVTVHWPEVTAFNPDRASYEISVDDTDGSGVLLARWQEEPYQPVSRTGPTTLTFESSGDGAVQILRCATVQAIDCSWLDQSPRLSVHDALALTADDVRPVSGRTGVDRTATFLVGAAFDLRDARLSVRWELTDPAAPSAVLRSGTVIPVASDRWFTVPITIPAGRTARTYQVAVRVTADTPAYGGLEEQLAKPLRFTTDEQAPRLTVRPSGDDRVLYPARDRYRDQVSYWVEADDAWDLAFEVRDPRGRLLIRRTDDGHSTRNFVWSGRFKGGALMPEGVYSVVFSATDGWGNTGTVVRKVRISHLARRMVTYRRTVSAAASETGRFVGRCSSLQRRAKGVLAFSSRSRCAGSKPADSMVATNHGIYLPRAIGTNYAHFRVVLNGAPARAGRDYLVFGYLRPDGRLIGRQELYDGARHPGASLGNPRTIIHDRNTKKPYVLWTAGLTDGSRYVVRSFTVEVRYLALVRPGRSARVASGPPQQTSASPRVASSYSS